VQQQVDREAPRGDRGGDRIDQERHVAVDDSHARATPRAGGGTDQQRRLAFGPDARRFEHERRRLVEPRSRQRGFAG
jgi:hypothetical protein